MRSVYQKLYQNFTKTTLILIHRGGHAAAITDIDALNKEACVTCGGRDESVIIYQIVEDKQLIFNGKQGSIDGLKLINDKTFVTIGQDGYVFIHLYNFVNI